MALFITGLVLILIYGLAIVGVRVFNFTFVFDMLTQIAMAVGLNPNTLMSAIALIGAVLMVIGNRQMLMRKVTCDECGWVGPKRQFIKGCEQCGSHQFH
jgi:hypothetical protein